MPSSSTIAERFLNKETSRAEFVSSIARLIIAVNAELRHREELKWEAEARAIRARCARDPMPSQRRAPPASTIMRPWRVNPLLDLMVDRQSDRTASLMGDPAPGRSALDQRNGGTQ
ncbi:hypothetical protein [Stappia sp.]|uniref:hypothetical protein n=1 Tax=Stappia sp. TaxID=1870903 RepID=UPI003D14CF5E